MFKKNIYFLFFAPAYADEELSQVLGKDVYEPSYFGMFFGLILVIALIYLTAILYKKLTKVKIDENQDDKYDMKIVSSVSLGQNRNLHIIKIGNSHCLIGSAQNNIALIKDLGAYEEN